MLSLAAAAAIAGWRFASWESQSPPELLAYVGGEVTLEGRVASLSDPGRTVVRYRVDVDRVVATDRAEKVDGAVLIAVSQYAAFERGERVRLQGMLDHPPADEDFDYRGFLLRQGIVGTMFYPKVELAAGAENSLQGTVDAARLRLEDVLQRSLPEPEASLAAGIVLGRDGGIEPEQYEDYRLTGLAHLIAVSGSNLAILAGIVFVLLVPVMGRNYAFVPAAAALTAYWLLVGADGPVTRAWIMASIFLLGAWMGRQEASLAALGAAVIAMTAISPGAARDIGFQLSVAATSGIIVFSSWVRSGLGYVTRQVGAEGLLPRTAELVIAVSLAATVATLPIVWVNFGEVSVIGPMANVVVEPLFVAAFGLSMLTAALGAAWEPAGWAAGIVAYYPLAGCNLVAASGARLEFASITVPRVHAGWAFAAYAVLASAGWFAYRYPASPRERAPAPNAIRPLRRAAAAAAVGALAVLIWTVSLAPLKAPGRLELAVLDVGQGDALLLTTPGGKRVLVDGGPSGIETARELSSRLAHWERGIHAVLLTHPQQDHLGGLPEVLDRYKVASVYQNGMTNPTEGFAAFASRADGSRMLARGDSFELDGVIFDVLWPPADQQPSELNDSSLVLRVSYGDTRMLLAGDIERSAQSMLAEIDELSADVLKVPHHGAATSTGAFFQAVSPGLALISVGADNPFGHPAEVTVQALAEATTYRTDINGRLVVTSDGKRIEVSVARR